MIISPDHLQHYFVLATMTDEFPSIMLILDLLHLVHYNQISLASYVMSIVRYPVKQKTRFFYRKIQLFYFTYNRFFYFII